MRGLIKMDEIRGAEKATSDLKFNDRREYEFGSPRAGEAYSPQEYFHFSKRTTAKKNLVADMLTESQRLRNKEVRHFYKSSGGFSLLEVLIVVAILSVLAVAGVGYYRNVVVRITGESAGEVIIVDLRSAQSKANSGESGYRWGVHFVNGPQDYYEIFSTPSNYGDAQMVVEATTTLPSGVFFADPLPGATKDVIFGGVGGTTTATSVAIILEGKTTTINVTPLGAVYETRI